MSQIIWTIVVTIFTLPLSHHEIVGETFRKFPISSEFIAQSRISTRFSHTLSRGPSNEPAMPPKAEIRRETHEDNKEKQKSTSDSESWEKTASEGPLSGIPWRPPHNVNGQSLSTQIASQRGGGWQTQHSDATITISLPTAFQPCRYCTHFLNLFCILLFSGRTADNGVPYDVRNIEQHMYLMRNDHPSSNLASIFA